jgi:flagellar basal-body rod modification protein FlgD
MPYETSALSKITGSGTPVAGYSTAKPQLLDDAARAKLGLPSVAETTAPKQKETLDGTPNGLGKDDFLKLLLAQMTNQDPLKPMADTEFISQLAQFNALEQQQQSNKSLSDMLIGQSLAQATALMGKQVEATGGVSGQVTAVTLVDGQPKLTVGSTQIGLSDVQKVLAAADAAAAAEDGTDAVAEDSAAADSTESTATTAAP